MLENSQNVPEAPKPNQSCKLAILSRVSTGVLLFLLIILIIVGLIYYVVSSQKNDAQTTTAPQPVMTPSVSENTLTESKKWFFEKKTSGGVETVFTLPELFNNQIIRWNNYLIYSGGDYDSNVKVFSFNLKTGEEKTIYEQKTRNDFEESGSRNRRYVYNMKIIDGTLFFSIGGYLTSKAEFSLSLPPDFIVKKLKDTDSVYGKTLIKGHYFIVDGFGDGCAGSTGYSLVDFRSKSVTKIAESTSGCAEGDEYINIDKRDRMLLAPHTMFDPVVENPNDQTGSYLSVAAVPLSNPKVREIVVSEKNMPLGITGISYLDESDQLFLHGKENYIFDFSTKTISKTNQTHEKTQQTQQEPELTFADKIKTLDLPQEYSFVLK